jgi:uncharacterized protein YabN with tetrapyrrole methylase and pyrophosphatase domain
MMATPGRRPKGRLSTSILFHAELAAEAGQFTIADVASGLREKMVRRHPHVYETDGAGLETKTEDLVESWERLKLEEKGRGSILDGIPGSLPALALTEKYLKKVSGAGTSTDLGELGAQVTGCLTENPSAEDIGMVLLTTVELARQHGINAEQALRSVTKRAGERYRLAEQAGTFDSNWIAG